MLSEDAEVDDVTSKPGYVTDQRFGGTATISFMEDNDGMEPVMRPDNEATDRSSIDFKERALVWHHQDAD
ncbi:unnamed protein product [Brassica napus]|uniref:(rape) hypothetical protein n=1 Tax=Brassica napus TaxID=3708 RepID=A0A816QN23_BRANA|nr:unnamed protein product [Brassica napus]